MTRAASGLLVLLLASLALAGGASADHSGTCTPTALGWLCRFDADDDGVPERVFVYSDAAYPVLTLDAWRQQGSDTLAAGTASAFTPYGPTAHRVTFTQHDAGADGSFEERTVRVASWLPSDIGGFATVTVHDANGSGYPERVSVFLYHSHHGEFAWSTSTMLP